MLPDLVDAAHLLRHPLEAKSGTKPLAPACFFTVYLARGSEAVQKRQRRVASQFETHDPRLDRMSLIRYIMVWLRFGRQRHFSIGIAVCATVEPPLASRPGLNGWPTAT